MVINKKSVLPILIFSFLLYSCGTNLNNEVNSFKLDQKVNLNIKIEGYVKFPEYSIKATENDIPTQAEVNLLYPSDYKNTYLQNKLIASSVSDNKGLFYIQSKFSPEYNQVYVLEASKRVNGPSNNKLSLRTFVRWNGSYFESITNSGIIINAKTTAISLISSLASDKLKSGETINKIKTENSILVYGDINNKIKQSYVTNVLNLVEKTLLENKDPLSYISYNGTNFLIKDKKYINENISTCTDPSLCPSPNPTATPTPSEKLNILNIPVSSFNINDNICEAKYSSNGNFIVYYIKNLNPYTSAQRLIGIIYDKNGKKIKDISIDCDSQIVKILFFNNSIVVIHNKFYFLISTGYIPRYTKNILVKKYNYNGELTHSSSSIFNENLNFESPYTFSINYDANKKYEKYTFNNTPSSLNLIDVVENKLTENISLSIKKTDFLSISSTYIKQYNSYYYEYYLSTQEDDTVSKNFSIVLDKNLKFINKNEYKDTEGIVTMGCNESGNSSQEKSLLKPFYLDLDNKTFFIDSSIKNKNVTDQGNILILKLSTFEYLDKNFNNISYIQPNLDFLELNNSLSVDCHLFNKYSTYLDEYNNFFLFISKNNNNLRVMKYDTLNNKDFDIEILEPDSENYKLLQKYIFSDGNGNYRLIWQTHDSTNGLNVYTKIIDKDGNFL